MSANVTNVKRNDRNKETATRETQILVITKKHKENFKRKQNA